MNKNDRWSALSMQQRADLIKLYIDNGITDIKHIKNHYNSFGDGGEINNSKNTKGYTTTNNEELQNLETFNSNWYKYRDSQLASVVKSDHSPHHITRGLNFWQTSFPMFVDDTKLANGARNYIEERLKHLKEFTLEEAIKDRQAKQVLIDDYYNYFPSEKKENEVEIGPPKSPDDYSLIGLQELLHKGGYSRPTHIALYSNGNENTSTKIHERAHATIPKSTIGYHPILKPINNVFLQKDVKADKYYYDDIGEIYSRLMQMRFENKIDPSHKYTLEEVKAMREDPNFKDFNIFKRYTDDSILVLLNDVAQNTTDPNKLDYINPANIAANGGRILDGTSEENQTLDNEPIYYDFIEPSVVKAFKSEKDYNKYKGEQFGKKVTKGMNEAASYLYEGLKFTPVVGDVIDATEAGLAAKQGNPKQALSLAGLALLPNALEKPIKGLKKGVKNLLTYRKYASQPERLRRSVDEIVDRYVKNAEIINTNYGGTPKNRVINKGEDLITANNNLGITTNYRPFSRKIGGAYSDDIWVNPYGKGKLRKAWFSPKEAIKDLHGTAGHEGTHFALDVLNDKLAIYDASIKYHRANPNHPLYQNVGYIFDDLNRTANVWERSPEEFIAEMNKFRIRHNIPNHLGYNQWQPYQKRMVQTALSNRFKLRPSDASYIAPEDINYILSKYADFGYKYGGILTKK